MGFQRSSFEPHPEGLTIGTLADHTYEPNGTFGPQTRLSFDTEELMDDGRPFRVCYWVTDQFNPKSNLFKFLKAMGVDVDNVTDDELAEMDFPEFLGRKCQLLIEHKKKADGSITAKVANLLPIKTRRPAKPEAAAPPARELVGAGAGPARSPRRTAVDDDADTYE